METPAPAPAATTWHYGLVARWWALFNVDGPEVPFFRRYVEAAPPALDLACGTGRLLVPYVRDGLDVDGTDVSADMIALCREAAAAVGASPTLTARANHELDLPRPYRTILCCGGFGLGATRAQDREGLLRVLAHLEPGGTFVVDNEVSDVDPARWRRWRAPATPVEPPAPAERRRGPDGDDYALVHRWCSIDPDQRRGEREMHAWRWHDGELVAHEVHDLVCNVYGTDELADLLTDVGFVDVRVLGGYDGAPLGPDHRFAVFEARAPA